jgi:CRP-like cAMP-binding protein
MTFVNAPEPVGTAAQALARGTLLQGLPPAALDELCEGAALQRLADGATAFHEGDAAVHCLLVVAGAMDVLRFGEDGEERVFHRFGPDQLVAEAAMFMAHGRYPMTARAAGATRVWRLRRAAVRAACERHPALAMRLLESLSERLYRRINEVEWLTASTAQQRLAVHLLGLMQRQGPCVELPTSQRQLATRLGVRAETLSRLLADWQARGWVSGERRSWTLRQLQPLRRMAQASVRPF